MPFKKDVDATSGKKLLTLFQILMLDGKKHFLSDLAERLNCSKQTISRLIMEIEGVIGANLCAGTENRQRWYQIVSHKKGYPGFDLEELRYLRICRDLASPYLPGQILKRLDDSIFRYAIFMAESGLNPAHAEKSRFQFFSKGRIDYTAHYAHIDALMQAVDKKLICLVTYKSVSKTEPKTHIFVPAQIISMNNALYAVGAALEADYESIHHCLSLAVHRIQEVESTNRQFTGDLPATDPGAFGLPWHEPKTFRIIFKAGPAANYVSERIWADNQEMKTLPNGDLELTLITRSQPELEAWVRSFGENARISSQAG